MGEAQQRDSETGRVTNDPETLLIAVTQVAQTPQSPERHPVVYHRCVVMLTSRTLGRARYGVSRSFHRDFTVMVGVKVCVMPRRRRRGRVRRSL